MIALLLFLLSLLPAPYADAQQRESSAASGLLELPEVILFGRDSYFLPLPEPPLPGPGPLFPPPARVRPLAIEEHALYPGVWTDSRAAPGRASSVGPGGTSSAGPERASSAGRPVPIPPSSALTEEAFPRSGPAAKNPGWGLSWALGWWPAAAWEADLEAQLKRAGWGGSLGLRAGLPDLAFGAEADGESPGWLLLDLLAEPRGRRDLSGAGGLSLRGLAGGASGGERKDRYLAGAEAAFRREGPRLALRSATRWLSLRAPGADLNLLEEDLRLEAAAGTVRPDLRLQSVWHGPDPGSLTALAGLGGRWAPDGSEWIIGTGVDLLARRPAGEEARLDVYPRAALDLALGPRLAWSTTAGAFLEAPFEPAAAFLETMPDTASLEPARGWLARSGLILDDGADGGSAAWLEYTRGRVRSASGQWTGLVPGSRIDLGFSIARGLLPWLRADLYYRIGQPLEPQRGWNPEQAFQAVLRADFQNLPLGLIMDLQWSAGPLTGSEASRFGTLRGLPGGKAELLLFWEPGPAARLGLGCELLTGPDFAPRGLRLGLAWQGQSIKE